MTSNRSHSDSLENFKLIFIKSGLYSGNAPTVYNSVTMLQLWMGHSKDNNLVLIHPMARARSISETNESLAGRPLLYFKNACSGSTVGFINTLPDELLSKCSKFLIRRSTNGNSARDRLSPAQSISLTCSESIELLYSNGDDDHMKCSQNRHTRSLISAKAAVEFVGLQFLWRTTMQST
jgi:hypothetical protein